MLETLSTYSYLQNPSSLYNCFPSKTKLSQDPVRDKSTFDWSEPHLLWIFWEWRVINSSSPFVKCQKSVTKDFEIFPGGNGSVRLAVIYGEAEKTGEQLSCWILPKLME